MMKLKLLSPYLLFKTFNYQLQTASNIDLEQRPMSKPKIKWKVKLILFSSGIFVNNFFLLFLYPFQNFPTHNYKILLFFSTLRHKRKKKNLNSVCIQTSKENVSSFVVLNNLELLWKQQIFISRMSTNQLSI